MSLISHGGLYLEQEEFKRRLADIIGALLRIASLLQRRCLD